MNLDNGNGAVVAGQKDVIVLSDTLTSCGVKIIKHANGRDYWMIAHETQSNNFYKFLIDPYGIHGPYSQSIGIVLNGEDCTNFSPLVISRDGTRAAQLSEMTMRVDLYDFDRCSGDFYNLNTFFVDDSLYYLMDGAFSPSGQYLYISANWWKYIFQFDVMASDVSSTRQLIAVYDGAMNPFQTDFDKLGLGPDNKIYVSSYAANQTLHIIHQPDSVGLACNFQENGINITGVGSGWSSVPNIVNYSLGALVGSGCDTLTSISQPSKTFINIYPNPVTDILHYQSSEPVTKISLYDVCGRETKLQATNQTIDVSRFTSGVYVIELITPHQTFRQRIVKL